MRFYPIFLDLRGRKCLVVGPGKLADEKEHALRESGAQVIRRAEFREEDGEGCSLIVASTDDVAEMDRLRDFADLHRIPLNVIDQPTHCSFIAPAIVQREDLLIAVSTSGRCPALASKIREELEQRYGVEYAELVRALGETRPLVKRRLGSFDQRRAFYRGILELDLVSAAREGGADRVKDLVEQALEDS